MRSEESRILCKECMGEKTMKRAKELFGSEIDKIFDVETCGNCGNCAPSGSEFLVNAAIQAEKIEWWEK